MNCWQVDHQNHHSGKAILIVFETKNQFKNNQTGNIDFSNIKLYTLLPNWRKSCDRWFSVSNNEITKKSLYLH